MSLETKIIALAQSIGADVKALKIADGDLTALTTTAKSSLVAAINELVTTISGISGGGEGGAGINDTAGDGDTTVTWSADKIYDAIEAAKIAVKDSLINGAGTALDTLNELSAALGNDANFATTIATQLSNRVRFDAPQTLTDAQKIQGRGNIGAAASADLSTLTTNVGNTERDFTADYATAKA